jgi:hypothetical protein
LVEALAVAGKGKLDEGEVFTPLAGEGGRAEGCREREISLRESGN